MGSRCDQTKIVQDRNPIEDGLGVPPMGGWSDERPKAMFSG